MQIKFGKPELLDPQSADRSFREQRMKRTVRTRQEEDEISQRDLEIARWREIADRSQESPLSEILARAVERSRFRSRSSRYGRGRTRTQCLFLFNARDNFALDKIGAKSSQDAPAPPTVIEGAGRGDDSEISLT